MIGFIQITAYNGDKVDLNYKHITAMYKSTHEGEEYTEIITKTPQSSGHGHVRFTSKNKRHEIALKIEQAQQEEKTHGI